MQHKAAHSSLDFSYHVVFIPKRRRKIFGGARTQVAKTIFYQVAQEIECKFDTLKIATDHIHMLLFIPAKISVSKALQILKSKSAHKLLKQFPELRQELPKGTFWATGYYARTIVGLNEQLVRNYIKRTDH